MGESRDAYLSLQGADEQAVEDLARLVAVADILECLCCVLAAYIEQDFLSTAVFTLSALSLVLFGMCSAKGKLASSGNFLRHVI